ncbi:MAG: Abi family protein [Gelidibacter sp.]|nr:Abi family protein [Gelidibacter sp.]
MGNIATNFNKQIELLKERGMNLDYESNQIKDFLLDIGYYRLGFYWHHFEKDTEHNFKPDTKPSNVIALYYLDVDLRNILLKYLNRIEINFRTKVVYYVSNKYKNSLAWFADENITNNSFIQSIPGKTSMLNRVYTLEFINNNKSLKNHHDRNPTDTYAPAWKTLEFLTFGVLLNLFKNIKNEEIKKRVSESLGILNINKFENLMTTVVLIRNICSHGDVLYDFKTPRGLSAVPNINFDESDRSSLSACIKVISYFLEYISPNRKIDFLKEIDELFNENAKNEVIKKIITYEIKYK